MNDDSYMPALIMVSIILAPLMLGFALTVIAWIKDWPKLERTGINIALAGVIIFLAIVVGFFSR